MGEMGQSGIAKESANLGLFEHGIFSENSHIRAHVAPVTRSVYVFRTQAALDILKDKGHQYEMATAGQSGVDGPTALGYKIPWQEIPDIRRVQWKSNPWWERFSVSDSTSEKGRKAVEVVAELLKIGRFPLWCAGPAKDSEDIKLQRKGTDIMLWGQWRIQVKCDYSAGPKADGGSGNLYLQVAERNPLRRI